MASCSICRNRSRYSASLGGPENSPISAPEKNVLPSQTSTTAETPARARMLDTAVNNPSRTAAVMVLTGGLRTVMTATSPSMASVTIFELMAISSRRTILVLRLSVVAIRDSRVAVEIAKLREQLQQLRPTARPQQTRDARLMASLVRDGFFHRPLAGGGQMQPVRPPIGCRGVPAHQLERFQVIDHRHEVRPFDAERLA